MSKTGRKWLKTSWADPDCVRAQDIPLSATESVKDRLDNIYQKSETYSKDEVDDLVENMGGGSGIPVGTVQQYIGTTAPLGWLLLQGGTIGDASSGATARANSDTETLYCLLWNSLSNAQAPVSSGRGATAAADFAAHKTITIPDARGRAVIGSGTGSGFTARTHGATGGAETHTLSTSEMPAHTHNLPVRYPFAAGGSSPQLPYSDSYSVYTYKDTSSSGGSGAHNNMQPWLALSYIIKY